MDHGGILPKVFFLLRRIFADVRSLETPSRSNRVWHRMTPDHADCTSANQAQS
jgi:hypothetical protein